MLMSHNVAQERAGAAVQGQRQADAAGKFKISSNSAFRKPSGRDDRSVVSKTIGVVDSNIRSQKISDVVGVVSDSHSGMQE